MRDTIKVAWLLLVAMLLAACGTDPAAGPPPADFSLRYEWREGSLPPPYHYEYTITLAADGSGLMSLTPDYPGPDVPVWDEPFSATPEQVDQLYDLMIEQDLLRERWRAQDSPPVGGSYAWLEVTQNGRTVEIPAFPVPAQGERAETILAAVEAIVPQAIRDDLERRRAEYEASHQ